MKKTTKIIIAVLGALVVLALTGYIVISVRGIPTYEAKKIEYQVVSTPQSIERGRKLVSVLCANCHKNPDTGKLTGAQMLEAPKEFGAIFSQNITGDNEYGIGGWTDGELLLLLRTGIKRDG